MRRFFADIISWLRAGNCRQDAIDSLRKVTLFLEFFVLHDIVIFSIDVRKFIHFRILCKKTYENYLLNFLSGKTALLERRNREKYLRNHQEYCETLPIFPHSCTSLSNFLCVTIKIDFITVNQC